MAQYFLSTIGSFWRFKVVPGLQFVHESVIELDLVAGRQLYRYGRGGAPLLGGCARHDRCWLKVGVVGRVEGTRRGVVGRRQRKELEAEAR